MYKMSGAYVNRLKAIIDSAVDKENVKNSIQARLHANATMSSTNQLPKSSKDTEIDRIITEFEGDDELSVEIQDALKKIGGKKRRQTRRRKSKGKSRKYSLRH
jgi:hypothetical protein